MENRELIECCDLIAVHEDILAKVRREMPDEDTLYNLTGHLRDRGAESVKLCVLLDKPSRREKPIQPDYVGFEVPDEFVVGYGLDYADRYRNLPYVGVLKPEVYEK